MARAAVSGIREGQSGCKVCTGIWSIFPAMNVKSLGYRTDLIFPAFDGEIIDRGDYLVVRSPANPAFYWGNFLLFSQPPQEGDFREWRDLFTLEIGNIKSSAGTSAGVG